MGLPLWPNSGMYALLLKLSTRSHRGAARRGHRPPPSSMTTSRCMAAAAVLSALLLLSTCLPCAEARGLHLHYHRRHRRAQHHGHHRATGSHISQPPAAALPPDVDGGEPPAEPPGLPPGPGVDDDAPPRRAPRDTPCPTLRPPLYGAPVDGAPRWRGRAQPPYLSPTMPPSPSPTPPARAPRHSPALPPTKTPVISPAVPPQLSPAKAPSTHHHAKAPSLPPAKPPVLSPSPEHPPHHSPSKPSAYAPANPPESLRPAIPPGGVAKPPSVAPAQPPWPPPAALPPAIPPASTQSPSIPPAKPPRLAPTMPLPAHAPALTPAPPHPAIPPVAATPPALPPAGPSSKNGSSPPPCSSSNVFDVRAFGASGNGSCTDGDTRAFRAAWKAACAADCATLLVPSDGVFTITSTIFAGPCKPGLTFQIDGVLMPPDGPANWPAADSRRQWIVFYKADGMTLTGKGTIEGNGEEWWNLPCKPHRGPNGSTLPGPCESPALIKFVASSDVAVRGVRLENSPQFHLKFDGCARVAVDGLVVSSPASSPNTDGVHVENTTAVRIANSRISNGDDCVSVGGGCSGVRVENVTCVHGHGISIGGLGARGARACVSDVAVRGARVVDSDNGVRIKTWQGGAGAVTAVVFDDVQMVNVRSCIVIDQYYCDAHGGAGGGCSNQTAAVRVDGVEYRGIRGTYNPRGGGAPVRFACSDAVACTGITMTDVELWPAGGGGGTSSPLLSEPYCWNAYGLTETPTQPPVHCLQEGRPDSLQDQLAGC
ncbi:polygalacturonase At1g48100-like [Oryza brachyantha]|uniref:polygalacturonase At1g48100-like n=1 Tax=Oryza brachyantha TaxID=4533 RepID=UPI001ADD3DE7|nr:polygalacturonase At1g48100-like [Oryza brachyantha]